MHHRIAYFCRLFAGAALVTLVAASAPATAVPPAPSEPPDPRLSAWVPTDPIPTNALFWLDRLPPDAAVDAFVVELAQPDVPVERLFPTRDGIDDFHSNILVAQSAELLPLAEVVLSIADPDGTTETFVFATSSGPDETPPVVPAPVLSSHVGAYNNGYFEWVVARWVNLDLPDPTDDGQLVAGLAVYRSLNGDPPVLLNFTNSNLEGESFDEANASGEACYFAAAWDLAGNRGVSDQACTALDISEAEAEPFRSLPPPWVTGGCSQGGTSESAGLGFLALTAVLLFGARQRRR